MSLQIKNLSASIADKKILNNISLEIKSKSITVLMGPNGSGKSTLAQVLMGHPGYNTQGSAKSEVLLDRIELLSLSAEKRAKLGLFLAFQNPISVPGVNVANLLRMASMEKHDKARKPDSNILEFNTKLLEKTKKLNIPKDLLRRGLNEDFSGGEKKKLEILQALVLNPKYAVLDEIDTGLDVDALKTVAQSIIELKKRGCGILIITHYQRILKFTKPDNVYILVDGQIKEKGNHMLAEYVEKNGYNKWLK